MAAPSTSGVDQGAAACSEGCGAGAQRVGEGEGGSGEEEQEEVADEMWVACTVACR